MTTCSDQCREVQDDNGKKIWHIVRIINKFSALVSESSHDSQPDSQSDRHTYIHTYTHVRTYIHAYIQHHTNDSRGGECDSPLLLLVLERLKFPTK